MKVVFAISILCFFVIGVLAQDGATLTGKTTRSGGSPDAGVSVTLLSRRDKSISFSTVSDENGLYRFENVPSGKYVLTASASGGMRQVASSATVNISLGDREKAVEDLELLPPWPIHEEVTVSADTTQPIDEVAKTVNVIDGQEMRDRADLSLLDTLRTIPGFRVQQLGGFGRTSSIKTRGLRNQDTALLIDGVRFRDVSSITGDASAFLSDLTLTSVSRIEVLRGSGSSLYGTNAIGGTIDFQTPVPQSGIHGQVSGALGELGLRRFRGNISKGLSDGKFGINFGVARTVYTRGIDGDDDAKNLNVQSRIEFNPTKRTNISARFFVSRANVRLNSDPDTFGTLPPSNAAIISAEENVNFVPDLDDPDNLQGSRFFNGQVA
jgi:iron complex outermembrane receptor protein